MEDLPKQTCREMDFFKIAVFESTLFQQYFACFDELKPQYCELHIKKQRSVLNHIGTVHAIAMCNMAELAGGTMTDVTVPSSHRWIPKGMTVEYLKKADTDLTAIATPADANFTWNAGNDYLVNVVVNNTRNEAVFKAVITMWVSAKK